MAFQKKERPSVDKFKIDFLDKLYDLDFIGDNNGLYRNRKYLMARVYRYFSARKDYEQAVIIPLIDKGYIDKYTDERHRFWGESYTLTALGREYLDGLDVDFDKELARQILRLIIKEEAKTEDTIIDKLRGRARLVKSHLTSLLIRGILDFDIDGYPKEQYSLTATAYLTYMEVKQSKAEKLVKEVEPENKARFENLLTQLLEEDD